MNNLLKTRAICPGNKESALFDKSLTIQTHPTSGSTEPMFFGFPDLMSVGDMRKALNIGRSMAYKLIQTGEIQHIRVGKSIKIPKRFVIDFVGGSCYNDSMVESE